MLIQTRSLRSSRTIGPDDDEGIEHVETDSWNNEQVHGGNVRRVVAQEGSPSLAGWPPSFDHLLGDTRLRQFKSEFEQFAVDAYARSAATWTTGNCARGLPCTCLYLPVPAG